MVFDGWVSRSFVCCRGRVLFGWEVKALFGSDIRSCKHHSFLLLLVKPVSKFSRLQSIRSYITSFKSGLNEYYDHLKIL